MDDCNEPVPVLRIRVPSETTSMSVLYDRLREMWDYRELVLFLAWRDLKVRYRQTALGVMWVILQPLLVMVIFSVLFGVLARVPADGVPYPLFVYCAVLPWQLFAHALSSSANSLITNERLVTKVYFPRLILPVSLILSGLVDFAIGFFVLVFIMAYYGVLPGASALTIPLFVTVAVVAATAVGVGLSALNVRFRDVRHVLPFLGQIWLLATPVGYPGSLIPVAWRSLYGINPMVGVVEGFRWALLGQSEPYWPMVLVSVSVALLMFGVSVVCFLKVELTFADVI